MTSRLVASAEPPQHHMDGVDAAAERDRAFLRSGFLRDGGLTYTRPAVPGEWCVDGCICALAPLTEVTVLRSDLRTRRLVGFDPPRTEIATTYP